MTGDRTVTTLRRMIRNHDHTPKVTTDEQIIAIMRAVETLTAPLRGGSTLARNNTPKKRKAKTR
jgi:hypothetical protein